MKYKIIQPINNSYTPLEQIMTNRGIPYNDVYHYIHTTDADINSPLLLGADVLYRGASLLLYAIKNDLDVVIIVDCDCDGFTSSALLINFLYDIAPNWVENHLTYFIHEGKQHGLGDFDIENTKAHLVILPDAGSNDYTQHKRLREQGIDVLVLDHHEADTISPDAIIINNQLSDYPNKDFSGVGITWQFCRYIHEEIANKYLDLVALGLG